MGQAASGPSSRSNAPQPAPAPRTRQSMSWRRRSLLPLAQGREQEDAQNQAGSHHGRDGEQDGGDGIATRWDQDHSQEQEQRQNQDPGQLSARPRRSRSASINRLSQLLRPDHSHSHSHTNSNSNSRPHVHSPSREGAAQTARQVHDGEVTAGLDAASTDGPWTPSTLRRPTRLQRARTSLNASISHLSNRSFRRSPPSTPSPREASPRAPVSSTSVADGLDFTIPDLSIAEPLDLDFDDHDLTTTVSAGRPPTSRSPSRRSSLRLPTGLSDRISGFRSDRAQRPLHRRRRSPLDPAAGIDAGPGSSREGASGAGAEDNTALLSRLLSVAAAATAATLLEGNQQAIADARSVAGDGDDGTFNSFLQSLESGRLAAALRGAGQGSDENGNPTQTHAPLNFFRMFRFGSPATSTPVTTTATTEATSTTPVANRTTNAPDTSTDTASPSLSTDSASANADGRMVPIIIVGIRSVNPASGNNTDDNGMPPFLDALSALPTTPFGESPVDHDSIDNILRSPQNGTHFTHRRRASMGGVNSIASGYDAQRHHRSPERTLRGPLSMANEQAASGSRPPPATPASPSLSRVASANSSRPTSLRSASRRESIIRTTTTTTLETTSEDAPLRPRAPRQRRLSESDYRSTFSSRRNGIVEPDNPSPPSENTRSWIIYVLGGSYPENHPILTTPSLFTDSPTYEDMMLLSALLGPAKPPVASEQDVATAGGVFTIEPIDGSDHGVSLIAVAADRIESVEIVHEQRCLVCLCDFEAKEEARQLVKCKHLFHKECIDEWLTKGRNSCPLCRGQGVDETEKVSVPNSGNSDDNTPMTSGAASSNASFVEAVPIAPLSSSSLPEVS